MRRALLSVFVAAAAWADPAFRGGAISTPHPLASQAGLEMLEKGGNAVDAAVAAAFALAVVGPYHSGLGGGGFALTWDAKTKQAAVLDFREVAPSSATRDMFLEGGKIVPGRSTDGPDSVAVPGAVKGYLDLLEQHGRLKRAAVLGPALRYAREGFVVTPKFRLLADGREACLRSDAEATRLFLEAPLGGVLKQPELLKTLERIKAEGAKGFYAGPVAKAIAAKSRVTLEDLKRFQTRAREPLEGQYRGHRLLTMPPPSAGGLAVVQVLGVLERAGDDGIASRSVAAVHTYAEALRRAYQDRAKYMGDPAVVDIPLAKLKSSAYLDELKAGLPRVPERGRAPRDGGAATPQHTAHVSVVDRDGNAAALTTTVNYYFGSCVVAAGFLLNDCMDDFAQAPGEKNVYGLVTGEANAVAPGKVPLSSMSPTLLFQQGRPDEVMMVVGAAGGPTIPTSVIQAISNVVDGRLQLSRALARPRLHHQWLPDAIDVEPLALEPPTRAGLEALGHRLRDLERWGDCQAVMVDPVTGFRSAASDPRGEGAGLGQP